MQRPGRAESDWKKAESGVGAASEFGSEVRKSSERPLGKQFGSLGTHVKIFW